MAITDARCRNAKKRARPYKIGDAEGLYLLVQPSGGRLWRMNYRHLGKQRTLAIGRYPDVSLETARERRQEARKLLASGVDPSAHKQAMARAAKLADRNTFAHVAAEYMASKSKSLAEKTLERNQHIVDKLICPKIGKRPIAELRASDILGVLSAIEAAGRLETAARARQLISGIFRLATLTDRCSGDPTAALRGAIRAPRHTGYPAIVREDEFGELLRAIETYPTPIIRLAMKFAALTFTRPGELRFATWDEIKGDVWEIPASRMKMRREHMVPLSKDAKAILKQVRALHPGRKREGYIFPSPRGWRKPMSEITIAQALNRLGYKGRHSHHGFRSSASTILNERGYRADVVEFQLAHQEKNEIRRAYNRASYFEERVRLMRDWAAICSELRQNDLI